jgi:hypothetical protein
MRRRRNVLTYEVPRPRAGVKAEARALANVFSYMTWGSPSVGEWRDACEASLRASRARRGQRRLEAEEIARAFNVPPYLVFGP